jgi:hypothetical protein
MDARVTVLPPVIARDDGILEADAEVPRLWTIACSCGRQVAFWTTPAGCGTDPVGATIAVFRQHHRQVAFGFCPGHEPNRTQQRRLAVRARRPGTSELGRVRPPRDVS